MRIKISWPQEGYPPIVARKTVRTKPGASTPIRFHVAVPDTGNVIDRLQSWQENHNLRSACHYNATILRTSGAAH